MKEYTIRDVIMNSANIPEEGWLCLPPDSEKWNSDTKGVCSLDSLDFPPDSDEFLPKEVTEGDWVEVFEGADIEDIVAGITVVMPEKPRYSQLG